MLFREKVKVAPYTCLAIIYDFVMNHVDYEGWANYISRIQQRFNISAERVVDISCGTGSLCYELEKLGYNAIGFDYNVEMIRAGYRKMGPGSTVMFWVSDMVNPAIKQIPDMVVSLYDSMNYLLTTEQWKTCLENLYKSLGPQGVLVFDVSTLDNSRYSFNNFSQKEKNHIASYVRKSRFDKKTAIQRNDFEIRFKSDRKTVYYESHRQKIRSLAEVKGLIAASPFEMIGCFHNFTFEPGTDSSERIHFVLRK